MNVKISTLLLVAAAVSPCGPLLGGEVERIDGPSGQQPNLGSQLASVSADGRLVAFSSQATNLIPNDQNAFSDIFLKDRPTGAVTLISRSTAGVQSDYASFCPVITPDGRYVAFESWASNLHPLAQNSHPGNVYVHDVQTGVTDVVNLTSTGGVASTWAAFPSISDDGRFVAFYSPATNLVPNDTNGKFDLFLRDRQLGTTTRITETAGGVEANDSSWFPTLSGDGRYVAFVSGASNLVPNDFNGFRDVFRWDRTTGQIELVSLSTAGAQANFTCDSDGIGWVSEDGRFIAFSSKATNLVPGDTNGVEDVFVRDMVLNVTTRVTPNTSNGDSRWPVISGDGRYVSFESRSSSLVPNGTLQSDVYTFDRIAKEMRRLSEVSATVAGNDESFAPTISGGGRYVVFHSRATNLVAGDTNGQPDIFLHAECWATGTNLGPGLAGTGGLVPALAVAAGPCYPNGHALTATDVVGGAAGLLLYGVQSASIPAFGGTVHVDVLQPHAWAPVTFGGPSGTAGAGQFTVDPLDLAVLAGQSFAVQMLAADPAAPFGVAMSNGVELEIGF
ncbi:MAG: TolB family protein [Planctomycetota bacterium JB042]